MKREGTAVLVCIGLMFATTATAELRDMPDSRAFGVIVSQINLQANDEVVTGYVDYGMRYHAEDIQQRDRFIKYLKSMGKNMETDIQSATQSSLCPLIQADPPSIAPQEAFARLDGIVDSVFENYLGVFRAETEGVQAQKMERWIVHAKRNTEYTKMADMQFDNPHDRMVLMCNQPENI